MLIPSRRKAKTYPKLSTSIIIEEDITPSSVSKKIMQKIVLVLIISTLMIAARKKAFGDAETGKIGENSKNSKNGDENLTINLP